MHSLAYSLRGRGKLFTLEDQVFTWSRFGEFQGTADYSWVFVSVYFASGALPTARDTVPPQDARTCSPRHSEAWDGRLTLRDSVCEPSPLVQSSITE